MRIFLAGGTGAIGGPLVRALVAGGHTVTVYSRNAERVHALSVPGVAAAEGDAFDADTLTRAVRDAQPDVVINQLTSLSPSANPIAVKRGFDTTSRLRREVSGTLAAAARAAGARRVVAQSISFAYKAGPAAHVEEDPLWTDAGGQIGLLAASVATLESATLGDPDVEGVVLRYGSFYGPGTYFDRDGLYAALLAKRRLPLPGDGGGLFGLLHVQDAAAATVAALDAPAGIYNVVDDVPAPASEWMPMVAELLGAKTPRHVPKALARIGAGAFITYLLCDQPAVSNRRARSELGWSPTYPDWHVGLPAVLQRELTRRRRSAKIGLVETLADTIRRELGRWNLGAIEESIFGTADPDGMVTILDRYCRLHLGAGPAGGLFYLGSAGCAAGIRLESGDDVAVKAYQERWRAPYLSAVQSVQTHLSAEGFPCPRPLVPPAPLQPGRPHLAMVESFLVDPGMEPLGGSEACRHSAGGLARQIALCRARPERALAEHPLRTAPGHLYGEPHSPLFDFERPSAGAAWIDGYAVRASVVREVDHSAPVVAHTDWSARNVRIGPQGLVAAYDWDSLALVPESTAVGQAAATWSVTSEPGGSEFPSLQSITEFVLRYEEAAGRRFDQVQWRATGAAAAYVLAYTARCEDSLEAAGMGRPHQRGGRDRLADDGEGLLSLARP